MKILMLILASDAPLYQMLQKIKKKYLFFHPNIEAYFYKGDPNLDCEHKIVGDTLYVKTEERYPMLFEKFVLALKAFERKLDSFDFISRPNLSTFILLSRYLKHLETLPRKMCCSGLKFYGGQPIPFPSGFLFTITPDIAHHIIHNTIIPNNEGIDDRCVGRVLQHLNVEIREFPFVYVEYPNVYETDELRNCLENKNVFFIRIRHLQPSNEPFGIDDNARLEKDLLIHCLLMRKYYGVSDDVILSEFGVDMSKCPSNIIV